MQKPTRATREGNMRTVALGLLVTLMLGLAAEKLSSQTAPGTAPRHEVTATEYEGWKKELTKP